MAKTKTISKTRAAKNVQPTWKKSKVKIFSPVIAIVLVAGGFGVYKLVDTFAYLDPGIASNPSAKSICGSGYRKFSSVKVAKNNGATASKLHVLKNVKSKKMCAVSISEGRFWGKRKYMKVNLKLVRGSKTIKKGHTDSGYSKKIAGPVYVSYKGLNTKKLQAKSSAIVKLNGNTYYGATIAGVRYF